MIIDKIGAEYKRKLNLTNYESAELGAMVWASVEHGDDVGECYDTIFSIAKETVEINTPPSYKKNNPSYSESFTKYGVKVAKEKLEAYEVPY
jgi:predicted GTPase